MTSIFTQIIKRKLPAHIIHEDTKNIAFLDAFPLKKGHTLVVSKLEIDSIFDLPEKEYLSIFKFSQTIAKSIEKSFNCKKVSLSVIGIEVHHVHIHLIPINEVTDTDFTQPKLKLSDTEMKQIKETLISNL